MIENTEVTDITVGVALLVFSASYTGLLGFTGTIILIAIVAFYTAGD